jgi:arylsulfate sulfotransferase
MQLAGLSIMTNKFRAQWMAVAIPILFLLRYGTATQLAGPSRLAQEPPPQSPPPAPQQNGSVSIDPEYAAARPGQTIKFAAGTSDGRSIEWSVNQIPGGNAAVGSIDADGNYTAPSVPLSINVIVKAALSTSPAANFASATVAVIAPSHLISTQNPQVAAYSIYLPAPGEASVQFGPDARFGLTTWSQQTPSPYGGMITIYVAGMRARTGYHMQATVKLANGITFRDVEHTFTSGTPPRTVPVQASTTSGKHPQDGIELFDTMMPPEASQAFATDLQGNVIWTYSYEGSTSDSVQPIKLLPNGHFLVLISSATPVVTSIASNSPPGTINVIREVDLAGNTIRELTLANFSHSLSAQGYKFNLQGFHHDVLALPNGHLVLLVNLTKSFSNIPGIPGVTEALGDLLVDVDSNFKPTWVWNTFDHLDINRHPFSFPDWTHGNALLYSTDDHNLLFSIRHESWIIKIDYQDGKGSGNILWRLGQNGDFKFVGGNDPTDWFYAQHDPTYFTPNTTGIFQLGVLDNGNDRQFLSSVRCGSAGSPPCHYSTAPVFQVDEVAMTATILSHYTPPASFYSYFGGNVILLPDGHIQVDFCAAQGGSVIQELDQSSGTAQVVWQAITPGSNQYRALRLPSLYPGVQWSTIP